MNPVSLNPLTMKVTQGYKSYSASDVARKVLKIKRICAFDSYLNCVTHWQQTTVLTRLFAEATNNPGIAQPHEYLQWYRELYPRRLNPPPRCAAA